MNRRILIQVTAPAVTIGLVLFGACLVSSWYFNRLQKNMASILSQNVTSLRAAQQMEITLRQLRFHCFHYLIDPEPALLQEIRKDDKVFEEWLERAKQSANTPEETALIREIESGYDRYHDDLQRLCQEVEKAGARHDYQKLVEAHPIRHLVQPCQELLRINEAAMVETSQESDRISQMLQLTMLLLGLGGPISGLIIGYGIARGLSRSIYQLSVRVQDISQSLEQDVGSVSVAGNGDIQRLDQQLQHVVSRVQEVAERLQQHQREVLRAQQLASVGQLAAGVAHEVRNPLTSIKMLVEAALRTQNRKPLTVDDLQVIHTEVARLEKTVQNFLDYARPPTPQRRTCNLREIVTQAAELVRARARQQGVEIEVACPENVVVGKVDTAQLCTVLVNLFINALDAMPVGGRLQVSLESSPETGIRLGVSDTGNGIPPEMASQLFTPFASTKPTGTGLGLSISQRIIEEHDGTIIASNRPEGGACFTITLPASSEEETHAHLAGRG